MVGGNHELWQGGSHSVAACVRAETGAFHSFVFASLGPEMVEILGADMVMSDVDTG